MYKSVICQSKTLACTHSHIRSGNEMRSAKKSLSEIILLTCFVRALHVCHEFRVQKKRTGTIFSKNRNLIINTALIYLMHWVLSALSLSRLYTSDNFIFILAAIQRKIAFCIFCVCCTRCESHMLRTSKNFLLTFNNIFHLSTHLLSIWEILHINFEDVYWYIFFLMLWKKG